MSNNYFRYTNQTCPICNKGFSVNDDIVVCPLCGTPHHRECYKQNGECGNYDKHNEGFRWSPAETNVLDAPTETAPETQENPVFNEQNIPVPPLFGDGVNPLSQFPKQIEEDIETAEVADFVQMNAIKYIQNFFNEKNSKKTFNWAAFFFTPYWFFYRKMHKLGAIFLAITLLLSTGFSFIPSVQKLYTDMAEWTTKYNIEEIDELSEEELQSAYEEQSAFILENKTGAVLVLTQGALSLALQVFIGFKANKWYYSHTTNNIRKIKKETADPNLLRLSYFKAGGCSMGATFLAILANNMIVMAAEMLMTAIK